MELAKTCAPCVLNNLLNLKPPDDPESIEHFLRVWCVFQFVRKVLPCPVLIVLSAHPKPRRCDIVYEIVIGYPDLGFVLPVSQGKLRAGDYRKVLLANQFACDRCVRSVRLK